MMCLFGLSVCSVKIRACIVCRVSEIYIYGLISIGGWVGGGGLTKTLSRQN